MTLMRLAYVCALTLALGYAAPALAQQKKDHAHGEESHFKVTPPADVKAAWTLIAAKVGEVEKSLASKQLDPIHEMGEHIEAAVHVLEEKSTMVTGDKKNRLGSALKQLDKAVDDFHHAAEDKDAAKIGLHLNKIKGLLPLIQSQYPPGALN